MALFPPPANAAAATRIQSGDTGCSTPRRDYVRLTLSIGVAADAVGGSIGWLYRSGLEASRPASSRLGRHGTLPASALGATLQARPADRRIALPAVLGPEFVAGFPPKAVRLCCISSTSLICNAPRDIVAHMSFHSLYLETMARPSAATSTRIAPRRMSLEPPPPVGASPCRAWPLAVATRCGAHPHARGVRQPAVSVPHPAPVFERRALMSAGSMPHKDFRHSRTARGSQHSVPSAMSRNRQTDGREVTVPLLLIHYALVLLHTCGPNRGTPVVRIGSGLGWGALKSEGYAPVNPQATKPGSGPAFPSRACRCPHDHLWSKHWSRLGSVGHCRCACGNGELT